MLLVVVRGLFVACALSGFGAALFALTMPIARDVDSRLHASIERQVGKIMSLSLAGALVGGYAWLLLETHAVAGTTDLAQTVTAIPTVLFDTRFGQILVLQALAIVCALVAVWRGRDILAASLAGTAVMLEAGHSHAFAMAHIPLLLSQMLHLTAAGAWLGGCFPFSSWCGRHRSMLRILPPSAFLPSVRSRSACLPPRRFFRGRCFRADLRDSPERLTAWCCY
jgi:putative copper export protein